MMNSINITIDAPVDTVLKVTNVNYYFGESYGNQMKLAVNIEHGMCAAFYNETNESNQTISTYLCTLAFRETDDGIQFFDGACWRFFEPLTQELWSNYKAEQALLES